MDSGKRLCVMDDLNSWMGERGVIGRKRVSVENDRCSVLSTRAVGAQGKSNYYAK